MADEQHITLPEGSFTAFRLLYGESHQVSHVSQCVLLGSIPAVWYREQSDKLLRSWSKAKYAGLLKNFKKAVNARGSVFGLPADSEMDRHTGKFIRSLITQGSQTDNNVEEDDTIYVPEHEDEDESYIPSDDEYLEPPHQSGIPEISISRVSGDQHSAEHHVDASIMNQSFVTALESTPSTDLSVARPKLPQLPELPELPVSSLIKTTDPMATRTVSSGTTFKVPKVPKGPKSKKVQFSASRPRRAKRPRMVNVEPTPQNVGDDASLMPLDANHKLFLEKIKTIASHAKIKLANDTIRTNQRKVFEMIRNSYSKGEIIKMEKMLVMIKEMKQSKATFHEFTELEPCDSRIVERWKEYIVVARSTHDTGNPIMIQLYTKREIPNKFDSKHSQNKYDFLLYKGCLISLYNSLDKTISIVVKSRVYLLKAQSATSSIKWFSFLNEALGKSKVCRDFKLDIPAIKMSINLKFSREVFKLVEQAPKELGLTYKAIGYLHKNPPIVQYLSDKLRNELELSGYHEIANMLRGNEFVLGFCWRYYDRLEWLFGENLQNLFWQQSMNRTHNLELRRICHYPTSINGFIEPSPIEGFLSRLTSKTGDLKRGLLQKQIFQFSFFHTSNNLLFFTRSYKALPPIPYNEKLMENQDTRLLNVEKYYQDVKMEYIPPIYEHNPYKLDSSLHISWLKPGITNEEFTKRDKFAMFDFERKIASILRSDGVLDMTEIKDIVSYNPGHIPLSVEIANDLAWTHKIDNSKLVNTKKVLEISKYSYFKIIMKNGVSVMLRAPDSQTKNEWITRLLALKEYWTLRIQADIDQLKKTKLSNIKNLKIDEYEDSNSSISTLNKWENIHALADPHIHNITPNSMYRCIIKSGYIFQKPKKHSSFRKLYIVLIPGFIRLYKVFNKNFRGVINSATYHEHYMTIPIGDSYVYSGNICELDLVGSKSNHELDNRVEPEKNSLPRVYNDGWYSSDDEVSRCFTLWFGKKRAIAGHSKALGTHHAHDSNGQDTAGNVSETLDTGDTTQKNPSLIRIVSRLGVTGKSMVFMCRSRQEKELWVGCLNTMLERFGSVGLE